ncbi:hypothetical protein NIES593_05665 [Hydrococcus rivularis NIES-593]|uniref:Glycosyltransferase RgtA/B/C/D-like domain-containing protein n=1 Tax=Hydrococcus rivularis NIES-593 TaxID=1921803 RepID=A0A1U7HNW9_9CYAN|nr:hypothetical protein [Hydrococcus rivularis]OKH25244.1 hypothetical protein NIES593_05665 [Hydrococcus rivularis NIES-593]
MGKILRVPVRAIAFPLLALICISCAFSLLVIKDFFHPIFSEDIDVNSWEYTGFYFAKNLSFIPFPHLNFTNNQVFYPYGTNSVFQAWGIERDIFSSIFSSLFGIGPWLQLYYLLTILITAIGAYTLLVRDYGLARASGVGLLVSFSNFYAIYKFPRHLNMSIVHWTTLSFIADFLIVKRIVLNQHVSLKLILIRACLLVLSLGQDLGYVAGFALMSFTVSILFIAALLTYRYFKGYFNLTGLLSNSIATYKRDFLAHPRISIALLGIGIIVAYIYLPLAFQIATEAKSLNFNYAEARDKAANIFALNRKYQPPTGWWTSAYRLLIPFLPGFNPGLPWKKVFRDAPEDLFAGSPGLFLLIIGFLGLCQARKRIAIFIPLLIIFFLCIFYHPEYFPTLKRFSLLIIGIISLWLVRKQMAFFLPLLFVVLGLLFYNEVYFPTLKIFPWFSFNRVPGRSTVIYPVILSLFALEINLNKLISRRQVLSIFLVSLICIETYTAYSFKLDYKPYSFEKNFFNYMNYVKEQPGEAVLDWPFCVIGGNTVGNESGLCPYWRFNGGIYALRRFHEKKVMGQYFGRLHPSQIEPYVRAGWGQLLLPDQPDKHGQAKRQKRCFQREEWSFFTDFYILNDFAGINLYVDLLSEDCVTEFYARFGKPAIETVVPGAGRVKFIPKPPVLRREVNLARGANLQLQTYIKK